HRGGWRVAHDRRSRRLDVRRRVDPGDAPAHDARHRSHRRSRESRIRHDRQVRSHSRGSVPHRTLLIIYRKSHQLRIQRTPIPAPPFWAATTIAPYSGKRAAPWAIDYLELRASSAERLEVAVCDDVRDELERSPRVT